MRSWKTLAAPDDPEAWSNVENMWPTKFGTYRTAGGYNAGTGKTATGNTGSSDKFAFCAAVPGGTRAYVCTNKTWEYSTGGVFADRTNGVGIPQHMVQFGNATIGACGNTVATVVSTGGDFSALGGAPKANFALIVANTVLLFNVDDGSLKTDGWAASDTFDHTNWTTGEAADGQLFQTPGPILAGIERDNLAYVFKPGSIYRGQYVGDRIKWTWEVVEDTTGFYYLTSDPDKFINCVCNTPLGIVFLGPRQSSSSDGIYLFDGNSATLLNPETEIDFTSGATTSAFIYDPFEERVFLHAGSGTAWVYSLKSRQWGRGLVGATGPKLAVLGEPESIQQHISGVATPPPGFTGAADSITFLTGIANASSITAAFTSTARTSLMGQDDLKALFKRLTPQLRRRGGSPAGVSFGTSAVLTVGHCAERFDSATDLSATSEASNRKRFDFMVTNCFARFSVVFTNLDVEIDDYKVVAQPAGAE